MFKIDGLDELQQKLDDLSARPIVVVLQPW